MEPKRYFNCGFYIYIFLRTHVNAVNYEIQFIRMEKIKGTIEDLFFSELKTTRKGLNYLVNGNYTFVTDMDNSFSFGVSTLYSPMRDSHFINHPYRFEPTPVCQFYNTTFKKYFEPVLTGHTNFPDIPPEGLCPIPKGTYFVKDAAIVDEKLPPHVARGLWKADEKFFKGKECIGGLRTVFEVL